MTEIPNSLRLLYETTLEKHDDKYTISIPKEIVDGSSLTTDDVYRVALLASTNGAQDEAASDLATNDSDPDRHDTGAPPVEEGEVRSVTIDTLGDQGDGIAKVERGFIVIVPGTQPGDKADVEITDVKNSVAFAEPVTEPEVR
ncbi:Predicted RNA-binding protein, contains TRAM domain [Halopenitus malekzadehii]|uniref:Predicted RNA-binding protein, contains TRAM domain n=1 Tax=Halopenitus malekzadehii TaxID=1267564 RepID=A0A1H6JB63_9EURY|nr:TRAM domain-containing protein [Halopenitus malekzadehii]SEH56218.1 Predicted RNA-binding protein, contains TRAM domain [Halopenitus malekzadehii]